MSVASIFTAAGFVYSATQPRNPVRGTGNPTLAASYATMQSYIFAGAAPYVLGTIDTTTAPWFTGTGKVGATTGTGNSDLYISSDGTHPTQAGHDYMARRVAEGVSALLAA